jgi:hypothetical protein
LDLYFDAGYPLLKLIDLVEKSKEHKQVDKLTFKMNWNLMKMQLNFTQTVTLRDMNEFQEKIAFHMTPYYPFTEEFQKEFGYYYRIVLLRQFFDSFPECINDYPELFIDVVKNELEPES